MTRFRPTLLALALSLFAPLASQASPYDWTSVAGKYRNMTGTPSFVAGAGSAAVIPSAGFPSCDAAGNLYIPDPTNKAIYQMTQEGDVTLFASGFTAPFAVVAVGNDLWVADSSNIRKVDLTTKAVTTPALTTAPNVSQGNAFAITHLAGKIYYSGGPDTEIRFFDTTTLVISKTNVLPTVNNIGELANIRGLAARPPGGVAPDGFIYFINSSVSRDVLWQLSPVTGGLVKVAGDLKGFSDGNVVKMSNVGGIAWNNATQRLLMYDAGNFRVRECDVGNFSVKTLGGDGTAGSQEGGQFETPEYEARFAGSSANGVAIGANGETLVVESTGTYGRVVRGINKAATNLGNPGDVVFEGELTNPFYNAQNTTLYGGQAGNPNRFGAFNYTLTKAVQPGSLRLYLDDGAGNSFRFTYAAAFEPAANTLMTSQIDLVNLPVGGVNPLAAINFPQTFTGFAPSRYTARLEYIDNATGKRNYVRSVLNLGIDNVGPVFAETRNPLTVEATSAAGATVVFNTGVSDSPAGVNSGTISYTFGGNSVITGQFQAALGQGTLTLVASDSRSNTTTKNITVNVVDTTPPEATVPSTLALVADQNGQADLPDLTANVTASDAVTPTNNLVITQSISAGTTLTVGRYPIIFTVKDAANNSRAVTSTVVVGYPAVTAPTLLTTVRGGGPVNKVVQGEIVPNKPQGSSLSLGDAYFLSFGSPALSNRRDMFASTLIQNEKKTLTGIVRVDGAGATELLLCTTAIAADETGSASGQNYASFGAPFCSPNGCVAFLARLDDKAKSTGLWSNVLVGRDFGVRRILQTGTSLNLPIANATLAAINGASARDGELLVLVTLAGPRNVITKANNVVLLRLTYDTQLQQVISTAALRTGDDLSGLGTITGISAFAAPKGTAGQGRSHGDNLLTLRVATLNGKIKANHLLQLADDNSISNQVTDGGSTNPEVGGLVLRLNPHCAREAAYTVRANVIFGSEKKAADGIVCGNLTPGGVFTGARTGVDLGSGVSFKSLGDPVVNATPTVVFSGVLAGATIKPAASSALYEIRADRSVREIVRASQPATDAAGNAITDAAWTKFTNYALPDGSGVVFTAEMGGKAAIAKGKVGLWAEDNSGTPKRRLLLHVGQSLDFGGTPKTVQSFRLLDTPAGALGIQRSYNSLNSVAAVVTFTDKSSTLLRIDLP